MSSYSKAGAVATALMASFAFTTSLSIFVQAAGLPQGEMDRSAASITSTGLAASVPKPELIRQIRIIFPPVIALRHEALSSSPDALPQADRR
jgi:hypothetical protein